MKFDDIKLGKNALGLEDVSEDAFQCLDSIESNIRHIKDRYIELGFHLRQMLDQLYYIEMGYSDFYECVEANFHLDKSAASRCIGVWEEFTDQREKRVLEEYTGYSYSQLVEMLPLKEDQRKKVTADMSVAQIRAYKKTLKAPKDKPEKETVATSQPKEQEKQEVTVPETAVATSQQKLSAYGTELRSYVPDSLVTSKGCEPNHDCFLCHLGCDMRQEFCHCVEAPWFPCTVIEHYKEIKEELTENCQFVNLELVEKRKGDKEPVPCCLECALECEHRCERAAKKIEQLPFPDLKNMAEREEFVNGYKDWKIWCKNELTEETFYRYDLPDGAAIVVKSYPLYLEWEEVDREETVLYLLTPGYRHFADCKWSMTVVKEYLKNLKKKTSGRKKK